MDSVIDTPSVPRNKSAPLDSPHPSLDWATTWLNPDLIATSHHGSFGSRMPTSKPRTVSRDPSGPSGPGGANRRSTLYARTTRNGTANQTVAPLLKMTAATQQWHIRELPPAAPIVFSFAQPAPLPHPQRHRRPIVMRLLSCLTVAAIALITTALIQQGVLFPSASAADRTVVEPAALGNYNHLHQTNLDLLNQQIASRLQAQGAQIAVVATYGAGAAPQAQLDVAEGSIAKTQQLRAILASLPGAAADRFDTQMKISGTDIFQCSDSGIGNPQPSSTCSWTDGRIAGSVTIPGYLDLDHAATVAEVAKVNSERSSL